MLRLPLGTMVRHRPTRRYGEVSRWCRQDAWNVPVAMDNGDHTICARPDLEVLMLGNDPVWATFKQLVGIDP